MKPFIILFLIAISSTAARADLRGAPSDKVACNSVPTCTGDCDKRRKDICSRPGIASQGAVPVPVAPTPWQGTIVNGLGQFLADRAKAEVATWFESLVRDKLCSLKIDNKDPWFPNTCKLLQDDMGTGQQLASTLLIEAVKADLPSLFRGLTWYIDKHVGNTTAQLVRAIPVLIGIGQQLINGRSPLDLLKSTAYDPLTRKWCQERIDKTKLDGACLIVFAGVTVNYYGAVIGNVGKKPDLDEVKNLAVKLFAEGAYRTEVCTALGSPNCSQIPVVLEPLINATVVATPAKIDALFKVVEDAFTINEYVHKLPHAPSSDAAREQIAHLLGLFDRLWIDLGALVWTTNPPPGFGLFRDALAAGSGLALRDYRGLVASLISLARDSGVQLPAWAGRLMPLALDLIEAKQSADVTAAIERAAAPIGSWKLKRQKFLVSISALVGGMVGYERAFRSSLDSLPLARGGFAGGLMAPVGLQLSWPCRKSSSVGVLFSVFDVGQVTWSRFQPQDASADEAGVRAVPDPSFAQVLSPGAFLTFGVGKTPFVFGLGGSVAPDLRKFTRPIAGAELERDVTVWRVGAFVAVDVTILPF